jgi:hypothetical protein
LPNMPCRHAHERAEFVVKIISCRCLITLLNSFRNRTISISNKTFFSDRLFMVPSHERVWECLTLMDEYPEPDACWSIMAVGWSACDCVSLEANRELLRALKRHRHVSFVPFLGLESQEWWQSIPDNKPLRCYRGCAREKRYGLSWTLERSVAEDFARGHRGIPVPDPVIFTTLVRKRDVLFATNDRNEKEVLLDPFATKSRASRAGRSRGSSK